MDRKALCLEPPRRGYRAVCIIAISLVGFTGVNPPARSRGVIDSELSQGKWDIHQTVDITSQEMTANFQGHTITFTGDVEVRQADLRLNADTIVAIFGDNAQDIKEITAEGNVRVQKGEKTAIGRKAIYKKQDGIIIIEGDPKLEQGTSFVQGQRIVIHLDQDQMEVQGRVKAEFQIPGGTLPRQELSR